MDRGQLLAEKYCDDSTEANLEEVVFQFTPLVKNLAFEASTAGLRNRKILDIEDLEGFGFLGLLEALKGFKERRQISEVKNKFITYAYIKIKYVILEGIRMNEAFGIGKHRNSGVILQMLEDSYEVAGKRYHIQEKIDTKISLEQMLDTLPERKKEILCQLFFEDKKQAEVAKKYGVSQPALSYLRKKSLKKLKKDGI
jgi:RNA polymerase sigma factor (sigma-70 family)